MPKATSESTHKIILAVFAVLIVINIIALFALWNGQNKEVTLSSEDSENTLILDPSSALLNVSGSKTFTAYTQTSTAAIPTEVVWSTNGAPEDIELSECSGESCTLIAGESTGEFTLDIATSEDTATADIEIINAEVSLGYSDEVPEWAEVNIAALKERKIMMGYADGSFGAADPVTRGQYITLLYRLMPLHGVNPDQALADKDCDIYEDVAEDHFAYTPICFAENYGWLEGLEFLPSSNLSPNEAITRAEAAELYAGAIGRDFAYNRIRSTWGLNSDSTIRLALTYILRKGYNDVSPQHNYAEAISIAYHTYIMNGSIDSSTGEALFKPANSLNRAETATIIWRILADHIQMTEPKFNVQGIEEWITNNPV